MAEAIPTADEIKEARAVLASEGAVVRRYLDALRRQQEARRPGHIGEMDDCAVEARAFIEVARPYSKQKGIPYRVWRDQGVPAAVLDEAGIPSR